MKKKYLTYILIAGVALIWGLIIMRLFKVALPDEEPVETQHFSERTDYSHVVGSADTQRLKLDYADPFLKGTKKETIVSQQVGVKNIGIKSVEQKEDVSFIEYHGLIVSAGHKKKVLLVSIHGKSELASIGAVIDKVRINSADAHQITITYHNKSFVILKN